MNSQQIETTLSDNKFFKGVFPSNHLPCLPPHRDQGFIVNTDPCRYPGQHWVAVVILKDSTGEYFDSFARPIPPSIRSYLSSHTHKYTCSSKMIQHPLATSCGQYCIEFIKHRTKGGSLSSFEEGFSSDLIANEDEIYRLRSRRRKRPGRI